MRRIIAILIITEVIFSPWGAQAYDLSHEASRKATSRFMTVALVPYSEQRSPSLKKLLNRLETQLGRERGIKVLDPSKTDLILQYYLKFVNKTALETGVEKPVSDARQALLSGRFQEALSLLDSAEKKILDRASRGGTNEGLYQIYLLRAKIHRANGNQALVQKEYDKLVLLAPDLPLDASLYSNWERAAFKTALEKIAGHRTASIEVNSSPDGSEVFLNGIHQGITPMTFKNLPPGTQIVEVKTVHHDPFLKQVKLKEGEAAKVKAALVRTGVGSDRIGDTIRPSLYPSETEISRLISTLGYHMGVDKVILVTDKQEGEFESVVYRLGDTRLGAVQKQHGVPISSSKPEEGVSLLVAQVKDEVQVDVLKDPAKYTDPAVGSIRLHEKRKRPLYKRPLFWVLVGVGAGGGGVVGAILASTAGAATTGGVIIGL